MAKWKKEDMRKHKDAILNQQGGVHYQGSTELTPCHKTITVQTEPESQPKDKFAFDLTVTPM